MFFFNHYIKFVSEFISFKSVSSDSRYKNEINRTACWLAEYFKKNNFESEIISGYDNPVVLAHCVIDKRLPTLLIYGHYDVQPAEKEDGWDHDPFTLTKKGKKIIARGVVDNKGQVAIWIVSAIELFRQKSLRYNIMFMIEGNEETGSPNLSKLIKDYRKKLTSDFIFISDGEMTQGYPTIEVGFRGCINATLAISTSDRDLHSGIWGNVAPNAAHIASEFINTLHNKQNELNNIFYSNVGEIDTRVIQNDKKISLTKKYLKKITGARHFFAPKGYRPYVATGLLPSVEVTGIQSGYVGEGFRNAIPAKAIVKLNIRIVKNQTVTQIKKIVASFVKKNLPSWVNWSLDMDEGCESVTVDVNNPFAQKAISILKKVYKRPVVTKHCGGSIPIVSDFKKIVKAPQVLIPLANEDCNMHGRDENFDIELIKKGLIFAQEILTSKT